MGHAVWQTEPGDVLPCGIGRLWLAVEHASGRVRHTRHRRGGSAEGPSPTLIAIGNGDSVQAARQAAQSMAEGKAGAGQTSNAGGGHRGSSRDYAA